MKRSILNLLIIVMSVLTVLTGGTRAEDASGGTGRGGVSYLFPGQYILPLGGNWVLPADFNRDGLLDLAVSVGHRNGIWPEHAVVVYYGRADGTVGALQDAYISPVGDRSNYQSIPVCLAAGHFNDDELLDMAVLVRGGGWGVALLIAQPNGGFVLGEFYAMGGRYIVSGDFNADGISDIYSGGAVRYGQSDGTLGPRQGIDVQISGWGEPYPAVADLNNDGIDDLVSGFYFPNNTFFVVYGEKDAGLGAGQNYSLSTNPQWLAVGDFNGDSLYDIAVVGEYYGSEGCHGNCDWLSIFYGQPEGGFGNKTHYIGWAEFPHVGNGARAGATFMSAADLNGDGYDDLIIDYYTSRCCWTHRSVLLVLYGSQGHKMSWWRTTPALSGSDFQYHICAADVDLDGRPELLSPGGIVLDYQRMRGRLATRRDTILPGDRPLRGVTSGDFDKDGVLDLAVADEQGAALHILWGDGSGAFVRDATIYSIDGPAWGVAAADLNGDDKPDLVVSTTSGKVRILYQIAPRTFGIPTDYAVAGGAGIATADFNKDGRTDLAVGSTVLYGQPDGTLGGRIDVGVGGEIIAADFDWDGWVDIAGCFGTDNLSLGVVFNLAGTGFTTPQGMALDQEPGSIAAGDFKGDGWLDLAAWEGDMITVLNGFLGVFIQKEQYGPFSKCALGGIAAADLNRDGLDDLFIGGPPLAILLGQESAGLAEHQSFRSKSCLYSLSSGDFDRDGRVDVVGTGPGSVVSVFLNQNTHKAIGDLELVSMTTPPAGMTGETVNVSWTVRNKTTKALAAKWTDGIYLSRDQTWDISDRRLSTMEYTGSLNGNEEYTRNISLALPPVVPGDYYFLARTDIFDDIEESEGEIDNVMPSAIAMDVPELIVCPADEDPNDYPGISDTFTDTARVFCYKLEVAPGEDLLITLAADPNDGANELYIRYGATPSRSIYDAKYQIPFASAQTIRVPGTQEGTYYIMAYAAKLPETTEAAFNLSARYLPFGATDLTPDYGGNTGNVTTTIYGTRFEADTEAKLVYVDDANDLREIPTRRSQILDMGTMQATFDLRGIELATCNLVLFRPGGVQSVLEKAFTIQEGHEEPLELQITNMTAWRRGSTSSFELNLVNNSNIDKEFLYVSIRSQVPIVIEREELDCPSCTTPNQVHLTFLETSPSQEILVKAKANMRDYRGEDPKYIVETIEVNQADLLETISVLIEPLRQQLLSYEDIPPDMRELASDAGTFRLFIYEQLDSSGMFTEGFGSQLKRATMEKSSSDPTSDYMCLLCRASGWMGCKALGKAIGKSGLAWMWKQLFGRALGDICSSFVDSQCDQIPNCDDMADPICNILRSLIGPDALLDVFCPPSARSFDPNLKLRPSGWGEGGFVTGRYPLSYTILFENLPKASAAALKVDVNDFLDPNLDWTTLELEEIGFGETVIKVPDGLDHYEGRVDVNGWTYNETDGWHRYIDGDPNNPAVPLVVYVDAELDIDTGVLTWTLECADPNTGYYPDDPYAGFLPPNQREIFYPDPNDPFAVHPGEGYLKYSVRPKADLPTGTEIRNKASIVFDWNAAIDTDEVLNTIDADAPTSSVAPLPLVSIARNVGVEWSGDDIGSGIAHYDIYVSDDQGDYTLWLNNTTETSAIFHGENGHIYSFYSVATDNVGHREDTPEEPDAETMIDRPFPDLTEDNQIGLDDLALFVAQWARTDCDEVANNYCEQTDFNKDGKTDLEDLTILADNWLTTLIE